MLSLKGVYLLLVLSNGGELGMKQYNSVAECQMAAQSYAAQRKFRTIDCMVDPVIGSPSSVVAGAPSHAQATRVFSEFLFGLQRALEHVR